MAAASLMLDATSTDEEISMALMDIFAANGGVMVDPTSMHRVAAHHPYLFLPLTPSSTTNNNPLFGSGRPPAGLESMPQHQLLPSQSSLSNMNQSLGMVQNLTPTISQALGTTTIPAPFANASRSAGSSFAGSTRTSTSLSSTSSSFNPIEKGDDTKAPTSIVLTKKRSVSKGIKARGREGDKPAYLYERPVLQKDYLFGAPHHQNPGSFSERLPRTAIEPLQGDTLRENKSTAYHTVAAPQSGPTNGVIFNSNNNNIQREMSSAADPSQLFLTTEKGNFAQTDKASTVGTHSVTTDEEYDDGSSEAGAGMTLEALLTAQRNQGQSKSSLLPSNSQRKKYRGVTFESACNKYRSRIKINGKTKHIGYFDSAAKAAAAFDQEAIMQRQKRARTNFPLMDYFHLLPERQQQQILQSKEGQVPPQTQSQ